MAHIKLEDLKLEGLDLEDRLIVAIDFGTTFSGVAYCFAGSEKPEVISIKEWPGLEGYTQPKIPTIIEYDHENPGRFTWGAQKHGAHAVHGIKLLLDPDQPRPYYLPKSTFKDDLMRLRVPPVVVCSDFIGAMYKHALEQIRSSVPEAYFEMCKKEFVLTVPAVWSDKAKDLTLQAAKQAGIDPVLLIKEPEAAALYSLHALKQKSLAVGDAIVVLDAGGGTVDLISYEIIKLSPRLKLKELVPSKGGMAGSLGLNMRFEAEVKALVGKAAYSRLRKTKGYEQAMNHFDKTVKTAFRGDEFEEHYINFPLANLQDDVDKNLVSNCWVMKGADLMDIFEPLVVNIEEMVDEQVTLVRAKRLEENHPMANDIKAILMVGGFGSNVYVKSRLEKQHPDIQIIQPHEAWSAIVKGAVLSKLPQEANIVSSVATRHYGVSADCLFVDGVDDGQPKSWDSSEGVYRVAKMTWYIARGTDLQRDQVIKFPFFRKFRVDTFHANQLIFVDHLRESESKVAARYPDRTSRPNCYLTSNLTKLDPATFKKRFGKDGAWYYDVDYHLVVTISSATMTFSLEVDGVEMGSVKADYK